MLGGGFQLQSVIGGFVLVGEFGIAVVTGQERATTTSDGSYRDTH